MSTSEARRSKKLWLDNKQEHEVVKKKCWTSTQHNNWMDMNEQNQPKRRYSSDVSNPHWQGRKDEKCVISWGKVMYKKQTAHEPVKMCMLILQTQHLLLMTHLAYIPIIWFLITRLKKSGILSFFLSFFFFFFQNLALWLGFFLFFIQWAI